MPLRPCRRKSRESMAQKENFSRRVKAELLKAPSKSGEEMLCEWSAFFLACGKPGFTETQTPYYCLAKQMAEVERLSRLINGTGGQVLAEPVKRGAEASSGWKVIPIPSEAFPFSLLLSQALDEESIDAVTSSVPLRRAALRGFFLGCGVAAEPQKEYRISFSLYHRQVLEYLVLLLHAENIEPLVQSRDKLEVVYFKDGQAVSDFLALTGAFGSVVQLEAFRVDKGMRNAVNRVVNCDSGNAKRQAEAGAVQIQWMKALLANPAAAVLPEELLDTARVRIDNPGLSLREIGNLLVSPVSKSGVNHRIQKLEEAAREMSILV